MIGLKHVPARLSRGILIEGPASGILEDVEVPDGHIVQVHYEGGAQPMTSGTTPSIEISPAEQSCGQDYYPPSQEEQ